MWYYKDGQLVLETAIISGKPATPTPTGVFYVWNKEEDATLTGEDYASPVDYWMPIDWTGVGIHDSDWQTEYGGDLWKPRFSRASISARRDERIVQQSRSRYTRDRDLIKKNQTFL